MTLQARCYMQSLQDACVLDTQCFVYRGQTLHPLLACTVPTAPEYSCRADNKGPPGDTSPRQQIHSHTALHPRLSHCHTQPDFGLHIQSLYIRDSREWHTLYIIQVISKLYMHDVRVLLASTQYMQFLNSHLKQSNWTFSAMWVQWTSYCTLRTFCCLVDCHQWH